MIITSTTLRLFRIHFFFTIKQCVDYHQTLIKCVYIPSHWQLLYFYLVSSKILSKYCTWHVFWNYNSIFMLYILKSNLSIFCRNLVTTLYEKKTFCRVLYIIPVIYTFSNTTANCTPGRSTSSQDECPVYQRWLTGINNNCCVIL